ncbi:hypothetical protein Afer_1771 [Acidimicrobium ferrooxidans DSM 10331]|uniref:Uncharacterized protein n=1 Tax=Acidimicrobium ferrooxidans (strain DSM 10331 / JCM 15462 / NBRC 103882 / ICP) TaxID=525909 RepID=C7M137_ACIFD|nr:hypothetical protein [Acidimicrobium ferrooxidans]ACU54685.1 hypothetical protein Afer_1771 [Acidimicrobium ferrooxidans DSM 10331]
MSALRRLLGDLLYWAGLIAGTGAIVIHLFTLTVLTPGRLTQQAHQLLSASVVQRAIADSLANALQPIASAQGVQLTSSETLAAVHSALSSPLVQSDFLGAMTTAQDRLLGKTSAPVVIGGPAFTQAIAASLASVDPSVAHVVAGEDLAVTVPGADVPNLGFIATNAPRTEHTLTDIALLALVLALVLHNDRRKLLARIGTWLVGCSIAEVALFWFLPKVILPHVGFSWAQFAAVVLTMTGAATVTFFLELFAAGAAAIALARGAKALV